MPDIFVGDFGTVFEVTVTEGASVVDLSSATKVEFIFYAHRTPLNAKSYDQKMFERDAQLKTDGKDGRVSMTTGAGDFSEAGIWRLQLRITFSYGSWRTSLNDFEVKE